jgi:hypothetical protein
MTLESHSIQSLSDHFSKELSQEHLEDGVLQAMTHPFYSIPIPPNIPLIPQGSACTCLTLAGGVYSLMSECLAA